MVTFNVQDEMPSPVVVKEAAKRLRVTPETIRAYIRQGLLEAHKVGRHYLISRESLRRLLDHR